MQQSTILAGAIVHLLVSLDLKPCNVAVIGKYLTDELTKTTVAPKDLEGLLAQLETYLAALHGKDNDRAKGLANEIERAVTHLLGKVRETNGRADQHERLSIDPFFEGV